MVNMCISSVTKVYNLTAQIKQWLQRGDNTSVAQTGTKFSITLSLYLSLSLIFLISVLCKLSVCGGVS